MVPLEGKRISLKHQNNKSKCFKLWFERQIDISMSRVTEFGSKHRISVSLQCLHICKQLCVLVQANLLTQWDCPVMQWIQQEFRKYVSALEVTSDYMTKDSKSRNHKHCKYSTGRQLKHKPSGPEGATQWNMSNSVRWPFFSSEMFQEMHCSQVVVFLILLSPHHLHSEHLDN